MKKIDYKKQGKSNLAAGRRFENKVRKDLEAKGWIVSRWQNNVKFENRQDILDENNSFMRKERAKNNIPWHDIRINPNIVGKCVPAKQGRFRKTSTGFPDFICYRLFKEQMDFVKGEGMLGDDIFYEIIFVECKTNGYLTPEEKAKAKWYLNNNYCSKFLIAKKGEKRGEIIYDEFC